MKSLFSWVTQHTWHTGMLWGLLFVAVPILIWLFNRLRFRSVEWAAQTFLLRALRRSQKRLKVENLLLLLIRCLVVLLFVAALARPHGETPMSAAPEDARRNVVIVLDTSYSTGYQVGSDANQTVHERERRAAKDLVRQLRPVDRVSVVAFDDHAREIYSAPRSVDPRTQKEILDELETLPELQRGARGTDYGKVLELLPSVLEKFDLGPEGQKPGPETKRSPKTVFLLTDMQRSALFEGTNLRNARTAREDSEKVREQGASFFVVDCGADEPKNAGVVQLETREPIVGVNLPCYIECTVKNWGTLAPGKTNDAGKARGDAMSGLTLEFYVDGGDTPVKAVSLDLAPEESKQLEPLRYVFHDKGSHRVRAVLKSDALQIDNERALVVDVREAVRVLLVDGEPKPGKWESETDFLKVALDPFGDAASGKDLIRPEVVMESALPAATLRDYDLVVLANVVSLPDDHVSALETYAREGGAVVFTMGGMVDREHYNEKLWRRGRGLFPCQIGDIKGPAMSERGGDRDPNASEWVLALANSEHPVLKIFADEEMRPELKKPSFFRFYEAIDLAAPTERDPKAQASVPLKFVPRPKDSTTEKSDDVNAVRDGSPALVEKPFGRGRVAAYLTTVDDAWTNSIVYDTYYLIFWRQYALDMARSSRPKRNLAIGERYERIIGTGEYAPTVEVTAPDGVKETFRPEAIEGREQFRIGYPPSPETRVAGGPDSARPARSDGDVKRDETAGCEKPGVYEVRLTGATGDVLPPPPDYFAVRLDPAEGEVAKLDLEDWREQLPALDAHRATPDSLTDSFQGPGQGPQGNDLWPYAVAGLVVLLALESLLAALFGRRRQ